MDDFIDIKVCSLNVRGLGNNFKRRCVFNWIRNLDFHLILLQETHSTSKSERRWKHEWGYKIIFNHGTSESAGICILFKPSASFDIVNIVKDDNGRMLIVILKVNNMLLTVGNIYGPNDDNGLFFDEFHSLLFEHGEEPYVIGGDFNTVLEPKRDKYPKTFQNHPRCNKSIKEMMDDFDLFDIWRHTHPLEMKYTWMSKDMKTRSRIDFFLISQSLSSSVVSSDITCGYKSDHSLISLVLSKSISKRGPGFWKLNTSLLADTDTVKKIKEEINLILNENINLDASQCWEFLKYKVRQKFVQISKEKKNNNQKKMQNLEKEINELNNMIQNCFDNDLVSKLQDKKKEFEVLHEGVVRGAIVRSKARWIAEGEKNTKYFANLEKRNYQQKCIFRLQSDKGIIFESKKILEEERTFYANLYSSCNNLLYNNSLLTNLNIPSVNNDDNNSLGSLISEKECYEAISSFANDKSPGSDGLPIEFYKTFWNEIKYLLCSVYNECFERNILPHSMRRSVITLLPKKGKNLLYLKNWRPISLLNNDYKILAKILSFRMKKVLSPLISHDQCGFLKGRFIGENIRLFIDIQNYCKVHNIHGLALCIDFEKAFDTVEWPFIYKCLRSFGFCEHFVRWVQLLYVDIEGCVINNGYSSNTFNIYRGVRQGCPLSPYLFILVVEILGCLVRQNKEIRGLKIYDNMEVKISQYADDTTIFLEPNEQNLTTCISVLDTFKEMSGLKVNVEKCNVIRLGNFQMSLCQNIPFQWPADYFFIFRCEHSIER